MDVAKHRFKFSKGVIAFIVAMSSIIVADNAKTETLVVDRYSPTDVEIKAKINSELIKKYRNEAKQQAEAELMAEIERLHQIEMNAKAEAIAKAEAETQAKQSAKTNTHAKSRANPEKNAVTLMDYEIGWITQIVQHEVGNEPEFYPDYDFDTIQQYMARTVINRLGMCGWNSVEEVLTAPGQYCSLEEISGFDANDELTRKNVLSVINGEDGISEDVLFEMSWSADTPIEEAIASMERQVGPIYDTYVVYANYQNYQRLVIFGYQKKEE